MEFDPYWLAIVRAFNPLTPLTQFPAKLPSNPAIVQGLIQKELVWVRANVPDGGQPSVSSIQNWVKVAPDSTETEGQNPIMRTSFLRSGNGRADVRGVQLLSISTRRLTAFHEMLQMVDKIAPLSKPVADTVPQTAEPVLATVEMTVPATVEAQADPVVA